MGNADNQVNEYLSDPVWFVDENLMADVDALVEKYEESTDVEV
ncbi:MAG: hypothetical protein PHS82_11600 [Lachnospiraceae bacterium]|nr:hypothetical protein [Lachnospiraceae bacterium]